MGDVLSGLGTLGTDVFQGIGTGLGDLWQGAQGLLSDVGNGLGGLFGGGSPIGPGTIGGAASSIAAPPIANAGADVLGQVGASAPSAATGAASFGLAPGISSVSTTLDPAVSSLTAGATGAGVSSDVLSQAIGAGMPAVAGLDTSGMGAGIQPPINPASALTGGGGAGGFLQKLMSNPKLLAEGGLLGAEFMNANKKPPGLAELQALASQQGGFAKNQGELALGESQGLLPQAANNLFQGILNANQAAIRSKYAEMGMTGSSAEMEDLNNSRDAILGQIFQQGQQMAAQGYTNVNQATGYESTLLSEILNAETAQGTDLGNALAAFAGAAAK